MRLSINLATKTYLNRFQLNIVFTALFLFLLLLLFINIRKISTNIGETTRISNELQIMAQKSGNKGRKVPEAEYQSLVRQIAYANGIIYRKTFSWLGLLEKLESVVPDGVSLNQIKPDYKNKSLTMSGTTSAFSRLRVLLENMENSKDFSGIYLVSQADAKVGNTQKGITFNITCQVKM